MVPCEHVYALLLLFLFFVDRLEWTMGTNREVKELCQFDSFFGRCADDEIIVIDQAHYGRMKVGRCISGEGYIGCETDVRSYIDSACAGRRHCNVSVTSLTDVVQPCRKDYTSYLEVAYSCRKVASDTVGMCRHGKRIELTSSTGLLASIVALETKAGSVQCPWEIRGQPGQQVRLKLVIYRPGLDHDPGAGSSTSSASTCPWFVIVEEGQKAVSEALCGRMKSQRTLAVSDGNVLRVYFTWEGRVDQAPVFVVQFEIIGCPDVVTGPASGAIVMRTGDELVVRCRESRETWYLTCSGNSWIGDFDNCSASSQRSSHRASASAAGGGAGSSGGIPFPQGLVIAVILGLILGLFVGSASLAALFVFRRRRHRSSDVLRGGGVDVDDDDYATEKLRTTDSDPDGYRSTFSQYQTTGSSDLTMTSTTMDILGHHRSPRCLAFYSGGGGGSTRGGIGEGCLAAGRTLATGRSPSNSVTATVGSPVRTCAVIMDTAMPSCAPKGMQSLTYETTRPCPGGVPSGLFVDPPKLYFELDLAQQRKACGAGGGGQQQQT